MDESAYIVYMSKVIAIICKTLKLPHGITLQSIYYYNQLATINIRYIFNNNIPYNVVYLSCKYSDIHIPITSLTKSFKQIKMDEFIANEGNLLMDLNFDFTFIDLYTPLLKMIDNLIGDKNMHEIESRQNNILNHVTKPLQDKMEMVMGLKMYESYTVSELTNYLMGIINGTSANSEIDKYLHEMWERNSRTKAEMSEIKNNLMQKYKIV